MGAFTVRHSYRIGVPERGTYKEILNSDHPIYGGSGVLNTHVVAVDAPWHNQSQHIVIEIPPLAITVLKKEKN